MPTSSWEESRRLSWVAATLSGAQIVAVSTVVVGSAMNAWSSRINEAHLVTTSELTNEVSVAMSTWGAFPETFRPWVAWTRAVDSYTGSWTLVAAPAASTPRIVNRMIVHFRRRRTPRY